MEDRFEATFVVRVPPEEAWSSFRAEGHRFWLPGFEAFGTPLEVEPGRRLRVHKDDAPCAGTEIAVTLEAEAGGTRITVVQSGFGAIFEAIYESLSLGWSQIVADLILFIERGVHGGRHTRPWAMCGCRLQAVPAGLEVTEVWPSTFAARIGLEPGDVLLTLGGAPVLAQRDLDTVLRVFEAGDKVDATWAHDRELRSGTAEL